MSVMPPERDEPMLRTGTALFTVSLADVQCVCDTWMDRITIIVLVCVASDSADFPVNIVHCINLLTYFHLAS